MRSCIVFSLPEWPQQAMAKLPPFECPETIKSSPNRLACLLPLASGLLLQTSGEYVIKVLSSQSCVSSSPMVTTSLTLGFYFHRDSCELFCCIFIPNALIHWRISTIKRGASAITCDTSCRPMLSHHWFSSNKSLFTLLHILMISFIRQSSHHFYRLEQLFSW